MPLQDWVAAEQWLDESTSKKRRRSSTPAKNIIVATARSPRAAPLPTAIVTSASGVPASALPSSAVPAAAASAASPPATVTPATVVPATVTPATVTPATVAPATVAPATVAPATVTPATMSPATVTPTTVAPATVAPATVAPATVTPATVAPATLEQRLIHLEQNNAALTQRVAHLEQHAALELQIASTLCGLAGQLEAISNYSGVDCVPPPEPVVPEYQRPPPPAPLHGSNAVTASAHRQATVHQCKQCSKPLTQVVCAEEEKELLCDGGCQRRFKPNDIRLSCDGCDFDTCEQCVPNNENSCLQKQAKCGSRPRSRNRQRALSQSRPCQPSRLPEQMMQQGYIILDALEGLPPLDAAAIQRLDEMPMHGKWRTIADIAGDPPKRSGLRQMMAPADAPTRTVQTRLKAALQATTQRLQVDGMLGPVGEENTHYIEEELLLRAKPGCDWQTYVHCDRAEEHSMQDGGFKIMHYSVMVALMCQTTLWIKPMGSKRLVEVTIPIGGALCWRGDIGHCGSAHPQDLPGGHYRLFMHVDAIGRPLTDDDRSSLFPCNYEPVADV